MKKLFLLGLLWMGVSTMSAQAPLEVGKLQFNANIGFSDVGEMLSIGADYGVYDDITAGAEFGIRFISGNSAYNVGVRGDYHFGNLLNIPTTIDVYAGPAIAYSSAAILGATSFSFQFGGRYFFTNNLGANLEFSGGKFSGVRAGITYKL